MSLVGTRPILQDELLKYELHHRARIAIKPGITGMWQVSGRSDITDFEEVVRLDGKEEMVITFENFIYECSHEPEEAEERYINSWKKNPCFELWKEILQFYKRNSGDYICLQLKRS